MSSLHSIIEFMRYEDMKKALSSLSGADLRGSTIELQEVRLDWMGIERFN